MDPNFAFPRQQAPTLRPPPTSRTKPSPEADDGGGSRNSNALRASVLDAALQLGLGSNSTVANWMFNNPVDEEDEEDQRSPALTYGSTGTSDESSARSPTTLPFSSNKSNSNHGHVADPTLQKLSSPMDYDRSFVVGNSPATAFPMAPFPGIPIPPRPATPPARSKLKKKRGDGYESDAGYISEGGKKKDKKDKSKKGKDGEERKRSKSLFGSNKPSKKSLQQDDKESSNGHGTGYDTDSASAKTKSKKSKSKKTAGEEIGYETDSGYLSSSSKSKSKARFFGLGSKRSKPDLHQEPPPLPPLLPSISPVVDKADDDSILLPPIASKFATSLASTPNATPAPSIIQSTRSSDAAVLPLSFLSMASSPESLPSKGLPTTLSSPLPSSQLEVFPHQIPAQRDSYGSAGSGTGSMSPTSSISHPKSSRGPSSASHEDGFGFALEAKQGQPYRASSLMTRSQSSPAGVQMTSAASPPTVTVSPTLSETTLAAIATKPNLITLRSPAVPSFSPGQIFQLPASPLTSGPPRSPSPAALSPAIPAFLAPPSGSSSPTSRSSPSPISSRPRPRFAPTDGFGPRPATSPLIVPPKKSAASPGDPTHTHSASDELQRPQESQLQTRQSSPQPQFRGRAGLDIPRQLSPQPRSGLDFARQPSPQPHLGTLQTGLQPMSSLPSSPRPPVSPRSSPPRYPLPQPPTQNHARQHVQPLKLQIHPPTPKALIHSLADTPTPNQRHSTVHSSPLIFLPSPMVEASEEYVVRSPLPSPGVGRRLRSPSPITISKTPLRIPSPGPSPNVLAYYDIPPPSPPPVGPLPRLPPGSFRGDGNGGRGMGRLNSLRHAVTGSEGGENGGERQSLFNQAIPGVKRGKESPFPQRPILPPDMMQRVASPIGERGMGLEAQVKVPRYRELYALSLPENEKERDREREDRRRMLKGMGGNSRGPSPSPARGRVRFADVDDDEEDEEDDMLDVLARFEEGMRDQHVDVGGEKALEGSRSFEAIEKRLGGSEGGVGGGEDSDRDDEESELDYHRRNDRGQVDDRIYGRKSFGEEGGGDRNSRWSGSIYSRASFLDPDKSEETRERFLQKVEEMYWEDGREKGYGRAIPPVPRIPEVYVGDAGGGGRGAGRSWNRF